MNGYMKSTGKKYKEKLVVCSSCGEIYLEIKKECPNCGSSERRVFQRTLASIKEEKETNNDGK